MRQHKKAKAEATSQLMLTIQGIYAELEDHQRRITALELDNDDGHVIPELVKLFSGKSQIPDTDV